MNFCYSAIRILLASFLLAGTVLYAAPQPVRKAVPPKAARVGAPKKSTPPQKPAKAPKRPAIPELTYGKRKYLDLRKVARHFGFKAAEKTVGKDRIITLTTSRGETIVFTAAKQLFTVSGTTASLSYPVLWKNGLYLLEKTDFTEFLEPLLNTTLIPRRTIKTIVIDAGHGGTDQGAAHGKLLEKNLNLLMARRVAAVLKARGYQVSMTRTADKTTSLQERCDFAAKQKPDLFLSIHCNSAEDTTINGVEVFIANPPGVPSFGTTNIGKTGAATPFQRTSALWAYHTQRALVSATKAVDRGVKRKQFKVIIDTPAPAMLVELGFLSNDKERAEMLKPAYQDKLAVALCDGIDKLAKTIQPKNTTKK